MPAKVEDFIIDFSKEEESGGGGIRIKEGTYHVRIIAAKPTVSSEKGTPGMAVTFLIIDGKYNKKKMVETLYASPKALSRFRTLLEACGKKVPPKVNVAKIAAAIKGEELYIEVQDDERDGYKTRSRVTFDGFISEEDFDSDDTEDDDLGEGDVEDEEEEPDEEEDDPLADMTRAELKAHIKAEELEVRVLKTMSDDDLRDAIREASEEEDEEEEPEPVKKTRARKKKAAPVEADEDLDDLDLDDL